MVALMRSMWCQWLFTGGKCVTKKELEASVKDVVSDFKEQRDLQQASGNDGCYSSPAASETNQAGLLGFKEEFKKMGAAQRYKILEAIDAEDITSDIMWSAKIGTLASLGIKRSDIPFLRLYLEDSSAPASPSSKDTEWDANVTLQQKTIIQEVETNLWILQHLAASTSVRLSGQIFDDLILLPDRAEAPAEAKGANDSTALVQVDSPNSDRKASAEEAEENIFEDLLQALIMAPLAARGDGNSRKTLIPGSKGVLERMANTWTEAHLDHFPDGEGPFTQGRTFLKCTSKQGAAVKAKNYAARLSVIAAQLLHFRNVDRKMAKAARDKKLKDFELQRDIDRTAASKLDLQDWQDRYDKLYSESIALNEAMAAKQDYRDIGLDAHGCAAVYIPGKKFLSLSEECESLLTKEQLAGSAAANSFFLDVRNEEDSGQFLKHFLAYTRYHVVVRVPHLLLPCITILNTSSTTTTNSASNPKAPVAVFCTADQMSSVTGTFVRCEYTELTQPYIMESTLEARTLSDKRPTDTWGVHSLLQCRSEDNTPYGTPFGVILRATAKDGLKPRRDHGGLSNASSTVFCDKMESQNPKLAGSIRDKYRFAINLSRYWQDESGDEKGDFKDFPYRYALANYLWWHCKPNDVIVAVSPQPLFALTAVFSSMKVLALTVFTPEEHRLYEGLKSMAYLCHEKQNK